MIQEHDDIADRSPLVVGIGSPHGDDQIGWIVAQQLSVSLPNRVAVKLAQEPLQLLDWLVDSQGLVVCDACVSGAPVGSIHRWTWPADSLNMHRFAGSHQLPLTYVLEMAARLGKLPAHVVIWGIEIENASPGNLVSPAAMTAASKLVQMIINDIEMDAASCSSEPARIVPDHA